MQDKFLRALNWVVHVTCTDVRSSLTGLSLFWNLVANHSTDKGMSIVHWNVRNYRCSVVLRTSGQILNRQHQWKHCLSWSCIHSKSLASNSSLPSFCPFSSYKLSLTDSLVLNTSSALFIRTFYSFSLYIINTDRY